MKEKIFELITNYDKIIIARHKNPDLDAYGSQFGLYFALKEYFPNKKISAIGDTNSLNMFQNMDEVTKEDAKQSLVIVLDTVAKQMLDEEIYSNFEKLVLIDHHRNNADVAYDLIYQDITASSTSEIITELLIDWKVPINYESAKALYFGIIGDTGRFLYNNTTSKTLYLASILVSKGLNIQDLYNSIYLETMKSKEIKSLFFARVQYTEGNVAYCKNDAEFLIENGLETNYVSRGLVNQMAGMKEVPIWVNFTEDLATHDIFCEIRARDIPVLDIAKKYGGGGHLFACGCTLQNWTDVEKLIEDLDNLI